jgi:two-component system nitrate/nitrite sensor histidine kinase NarX
MEAWMEYLASPAVRERCNTCENHASLTTTCPLLKGPFSDAIGMFCLPLRRGEHEFGVLNLFMPNVENPDTKTKAFLQALMDETALALEGVRLRRREQETLRQMQALRQKTDLAALLASLLENVHKTLESDFAVIIVQNTSASPCQVVLGDYPAQNSSFIEGVLQGVVASAEPVLLGDVAGDPASPPGLRSLLAAPLLSAERKALGALVVGNRRPGGFHPRQLALLQTVAGQVSLLVQNANLMAELEYKAMIEERARLAREIHDGLAQTLGFLKLQAAQMKNYLARNELERLRQSTNLCYSTISEAYQDVRQAIDGLRIWPAESGLSGWLEQTVTEFEQTSGLAVETEIAEVSAILPPEVHAQLIRIIQEALSNVRKHANARQVW